MSNLVLLLIAALDFTIGGCQVNPPSPVPTAGPATTTATTNTAAPTSAPHTQQAPDADATAAPDGQTALQKLNQLVVVPENTWFGNYNRKNDFGKPWIDTDHNGCDTRDDVLGQSLTAIRMDRRGCKVFEGDLYDQYTGQTFHYVRGKSNNIDIDHIVPLHRAWILGAHSWSSQQRVLFANDPKNLIAVSHIANVKKSDKGPGEWMPNNPAFTCTYAYRYVDVSSAYHLPITPGDKRVLSAILNKCI